MRKEKITVHVGSKLQEIMDRIVKNEAKVVTIWENVKSGITTFLEKEIRKQNKVSARKETMYHRCCNK